MLVLLLKRLRDDVAERIVQTFVGYGFIPFFQRLALFKGIQIGFGVKSIIAWTD
jgi:hypothetical protein